MYRHWRIIAPAAFLATAACGHLEHNDVLVFATQTKVALDVSTSAVNGGTPSFTLGYKRDEGVWMPLVINGRNSTLLNGQRVCDADKQCYQVAPVALQAFRECALREVGPPVNCLKALAQDVKYTGRYADRSDTYSVFASFGGDFGASGGGKAALAQFFATGVAAQRLADNPNVEQALSAKEADAQVVDQAKKAAEQANAERIAALRQLGVEPAEVVVIPLAAAINKSITCWNGNRTAFRAKAKQELTGNRASIAAAFEPDDEAMVRGTLGLTVNSNDDATALNAVTSAVCPT
jgi:hypothetical protein